MYYEFCKDKKYFYICGTIGSGKTAKNIKYERKNLSKN